MFDAPLGSSAGTAFASARDRMGCRVAQAGTSAALGGGMPSTVASDPERTRRDERSKKKKIG